MLLPYNPNARAVANPQFNRPPFPANNEINDSELIGSLFGLAHQLMAEVLRTARDCAGMPPPHMNAMPNHPYGKMFGVSAMNVTQITRGPDGRPHVVQAHNERRMGPGGVWQTKKALHDPDRGIDKVQIGYFAGDHGEVMERRFDRATGQYQQEVQRRDYAPNEVNYPPLPIAHQPSPYYPPSQPQYPYYAPPPPQQQQQQQQQQPYPFYPPQQPLPAYRQQPISALISYPTQAPAQPAASLTPYPEKPAQNRPPHPPSAVPLYPYI